MTSTKFAKFSLEPYLLRALEGLGFYDPTEIQEQIIPKALKGTSVVGQSQTGTGKTHAFLIPVLSNIDRNSQKVQAVITAPTRELASQIYQEILKIMEYAQPEEKISAKLFIGGQDKEKSIEKLKIQPQIVVGTPGRINDLAREGALLVHTAHMFVVDEADMMLEMGFLEDVDKIAARLPKEVQIFVFSATIPEKLRPFIKKYLDHPLFIQINPKQKTVKNIEHWLVPVRHRNKLNLLGEALKAFNPYLAIVFCNTKQRADEVAEGLSNMGIRCALLHGDLSPRERKRVMNKIRKLEYQFIVATDLASRGIDIEGVSHVVNYELPQDLNFYIHRSGRTGRGEYSGISAILYDPEDEPAIDKLEKMGIRFKNKDLVKGEWADLSDRKERANRKKTSSGNPLLAQKAKSKHPKKVKPGYKKKMKLEMEKKIRKSGRGR